MKQYTINKNVELNVDYAGKIIRDFSQNVLPILKKRFDYYIGKQEIMRRVPSDDGKPCNRIVTNYVNSMVKAYKGYSVGVPVTYSSKAEGFENLMDVFNYNDIDNEDGDFFKDALIFGRSCEICYVDDAKMERFKNLDPRTIIPVYSDDLDDELLYVIRFWSNKLTATDTEEYFIEIYDKYEVTTYSSGAGFQMFAFVGKKPHYYSQVPFTIFSLNDEEEGIGDQIISLQDAYNSLLSDSVDDFDSFCDAYMVIKGMTADDEDIKAMKEHRVLLMDADASAEYLTKDVSTQEIENLLSTCETKIREIGACPNFSSETFNTSSGIAIRYRLMAMENNVSDIMANFKKALQRRIELLSDVIRLKEGTDLWRDIEITFHRNIPSDLSNVASEINSFRGLVSDETLLGQIPFINDVEEELKKVQKENEAKSQLYKVSDNGLLEE